MTHTEVWIGVIAKWLLDLCGSYEAAKDALLKAAGMYSRAVADWPDGGPE